MRYCRECGAPHHEDAAFCKACGTSTTPSRDPRPEEATDLPDGGPSGTDVLSAAGEPSPRPAWLRRNRLLVASRVLLVLGLIGSGVVVGWAMGADRDLVRAEAEATAGAASDAPDPGVPVMPDVRGLAADEARQVLADVGVPAAVVSVTETPAAGETGVVIEQTPVYGYPVDAAVSLSVSSAAVVPKFAGRSADEVLDDLDDLGAQVETTTAFLPDVPVGEVASLDPAPGSPLPETVGVVISAEPDELALSEVPAVEDSCYVGEDSVDGTAYDALLLCSSGSTPTDQTWIVDRAAARLTGVVGVPDSSDPSTSMSLQVIADGRVLADVSVGYGTAQPLDLDVSGVLRLTVRYRSATEDYGDVALGDLVVLGDAVALEALTG